MNSAPPLSVREVLVNALALHEAGHYETTLLESFLYADGPRLPLNFLREAFHLADRARLRSAGDPLPHDGPFTLFRGVAGDSPVLGLSWSLSLTVARFYAARVTDITGAPLAEPFLGGIVYRAIVPESLIYAYAGQGWERLMIVDDAELRAEAIERGLAEIYAGWMRDGFDPIVLERIEQSDPKVRALLGQLEAAISGARSQYHARKESLVVPNGRDPLHRCRQCGGSHKTRAHVKITQIMNSRERI